MLSVKKVTLDQESTLQGVERIPVIGWEIDSSHRNVKQTSYQLQISQNEKFDDIIYDGGVEYNDASNNIIIQNFPLTPSTRYFVRVRIRDNFNESSAWSGPAEFVTGLLSSRWKAKFISAENPQDKNNSKATLVRKIFSINDTKTMTSAFAHVSALGIYQLHVNGNKVGHDELTPGWTSYHNHLLYQTYDLTDSLSKGMRLC